MAIVRIDHVQLAMPPGSESVALEFYCKVLDLTEIPKPPELAVRGGLWFSAATVQVHLGVDAGFHPAVKAHPAFVVDNLSDILQRCAREGYRVSDHDAADGIERSYVYDPFGNRIELIQLVRKS